MRYTWDGYCLDREKSVLAHRGRHIDVSRKVLDCIACLLEERHRVVTHEELFRRLWGHGDVSSQQLIQIVVAARRAIGDDGKFQARIRTVPRVGYSWAGPDVSVSSEPVAQDIASSGAAGSASEASEASATCANPMSSSASAACHDLPVTPGARQNTPLWSEANAGVLPAAVVFPGASVPISAPPTMACPAVGPPSRTRLARVASPAAAVLASIACLLQLTLGAGDRRIDSALANVAPASPTGPPVRLGDSIARIDDLLWSGDIAKARLALDRLPPDLAGLPQYGILEIRADIESGHYQDAARELVAQSERHAAKADLALRVEWLTLQSLIASRSGRSGDQVFAPAQQAVALVEADEERIPATVAGDAYLARGVGALFLGRFEMALRDLVRAQDIFQRVHDHRRMVAARHMLAHTWLRNGRLGDAAEEFGRAASLARQAGYTYGEVLARNSTTRIQIEQMRRDDAVATSRRSLDVAAAIVDVGHRAYTMRLHALALTEVGRLGEARELLQGAQALRSQPSVAGILHHLASGNSESAASESLTLFAEFGPDSNANLILSSQEGLLLLWTMAAQQRVADGHEPPQPSAAQLRVLQRPQSIPGQIARGRWLLLQGASDEAERTLHTAYRQAADAERPLYMSLAAEPLIERMLQRHAVAEAEDLLVSLRGNAPDRMARDHRVAVLALRLAHANGDAAAIRGAYLRALAVAGERRLPPELRRLSAPTAPAAPQPQPPLARQ